VSTNEALKTSSCFNGRFTAAGVGPFANAYQLSNTPPVNQPTSTLLLRCMPLKDYYKILDIAPGATETDIKKSFRRLALRYHPDVNQGNKYAEAWFRELQEAYDTLTDVAKKDAYLQDRWLLQSQGKNMARPVPLTPDTIVAEARELANRVADLDHFRMDHQQLAQSLLQLLDNERLDILRSFTATQEAQNIGQLLLSSSEPVDYPLLQPFYQRMQLLANISPALQPLIASNRNRRRQQYFWERNQWWILLLLTVGLCAGIALMQ